MDGAIAPLVAVVPLRVRFQQGKVAGYIQSCQSSITRLIPYEHVPLGTIQRWLGVTTLIDVLFSVREDTPPNNYECFEHIPLHPPPPEVCLSRADLTSHFADVVTVSRRSRDRGQHSQRHHRTQVRSCSEPGSHENCPAASRRLRIVCKIPFRISRAQPFSPGCRRSTHHRMARAAASGSRVGETCRSTDC